MPDNGRLAHSQSTSPCPTQPTKYYPHTPYTHIHTHPIHMPFVSRLQFMLVNHLLRTALRCSVLVPGLPSSLLPRTSLGWLLYTHIHTHARVDSDDTMLAAMEDDCRVCNPWGWRWRLEVGVRACEAHQG